jgi:chloramphenicol O-acetyltransferase
VYAKNVTPNAFTPSFSTDTQLFTKTGQGVVSQLTGVEAVAEGYVWVSGILIQWGAIPNLAFGTITFKDIANRPQGIPFPTAIFTVVAGLKSNGASALPASVGVQNLSLTGFNFRSTGFSATWVGAYWIAIGN